MLRYEHSERAVSAVLCASVALSNDDDDNNNYGRVAGAYMRMHV